MSFVLSPADKMFLSTIFISIEFKNEKQETLLSQGTGFIYEAVKYDIPINVLITNNHVIPKEPNIVKISANFHTIKDGEVPTALPTQYQTVSVEFQQDLIVRHPDKQIDLCLIPLNPFQNQIERNGDIIMVYEPFTSSWIPPKGKFFDSIEEIITLGFPKGPLFLDDKNSYPIARKGITATPLNLDFRGEKQFLIDVDGISGSSGAPVLLYDAIGSKNRDSNGCFNISISTKPKVYLIGVYCGHFSYSSDTSDPEIQSVNSSNIGIVIKADQIHALIDELFRCHYH